MEQSRTPSQTLSNLTQPPSAGPQKKLLALHDVTVVLQEASSSPWSPGQSSFLSQRIASGMQVPSKHRNSDVEQPSRVNTSETRLKPTRKLKTLKQKHE